MKITSTEKAFTFIYGAICYLIAISGLIWMIGFEENLWFSKTIDKGNTSEIMGAIVVDFGLILLFGLMHSGMARASYKKWITKIIPSYLERSTFILVTGIVLIFICWAWRPMPILIYDFSDSFIKWILWAINFIGVGIVLSSVLYNDALDIGGWQQIFNHWKGKVGARSNLKTPGLYQLVRHPLYLGFFILFWSSASLSFGHLIFSLGMTVYIYIGIYFEEKDLVRTYGNDYISYSKETPELLPNWKNSQK